MMSRRNEQLEERLHGWAQEYAGGRYENIGHPGISPLYSAIIYHGPAPQGLNPRRIPINSKADEVEQAVLALQLQEGGYVAASVLRCEYWLQEKAFEHRQQMLAKIGARVSRSKYSTELKIARIHVAGWLRIPFDKAA